MKGGSQVRALACGCLTIAFGACAPPAPRKPSPDSNFGSGRIPPFNADSVTRDSASNRTYALVGTVVDSADGKPIWGAQVLLRQPPTAQARYAYTDSLGGFVLGRVAPGHYELMIRRIGYLAARGTRDARAGKVDTLRATMKTSSGDQDLQIEIVPANTSPACHAADAVSAEMIRRFRSTMTSSDPRVVRSRTMMRLPKIDPSLIVLATDESFCRRAREAVDSVIHSTNPRALAQFRPRPPSYVIRIGDYTAVMDYRLPLTPDDLKRGISAVSNGEDIFDPKWNYIAVVVFN
jgi:hypothetical protein